MKNKKIYNNWLFWVLACVFIAFIAVSWHLYNHEQNKIIRDRYDELYDFSKIKTAQIQDWLNERKAEGLFISKNSDFSNIVLKYIKTKSPLSLSEVQNWLRPMKDNHDYCAVFLFDSNKNLYTIFDDDDYNSHIDTTFFIKSLSDNKVHMGDFSIYKSTGVFIDVAASLDLKNYNKKVMICLRINPLPRFFPFLQLNLVNYPSAEFVLLKRDGDSVLYLNALRFKPNSAMKVLMPLTKTSAPSVQAVLGKRGFVEGTDYRGEDVLAYITLIEGTSWYAENKVDKSDIFKELNYLSIVVALIVFSVLLLLLTIILIRDVTERSIQQKKLHELTAHLVEVREKERITVARELHDDLGQLLTSIKMNTAILTRELKKRGEDGQNAAVYSEIHEINSTVDKTLKGLRRIITLLRPVELENLGLIPAIESLISDFKKTSFIECSFIKNFDEINTSDDAKLSIYRIIQESLTNISRHSKADHVEIELLKKNDTLLSLCIKDDGIGLRSGDPFKGKSFGLMGIRERVETLNGDLNIKSSPSKGTEIKITIPLRYQ